MLKVWNPKPRNHRTVCVYVYVYVYVYACVYVLNVD